MHSLYKNVQKRKKCVNREAVFHKLAFLVVRRVVTFGSGFTVGCLIDYCKSDLHGDVSLSRGIVTVSREFEHFVGGAPTPCAAESVSS